MKVNVVGYQEVEYTSKKTGNKVSGISLYISRVPNSKETGTHGLVTDKVWISSSLIQSKGFIPKIDSMVELIYEFDGRNVFLSDYTNCEKGE